jgi:phosphoglycolate phosphatase-like HAD superfamily hydrolase
VLTESADVKAAAFAELYGGYGAEVLAAVMAHHEAHEGISRIEKIRHCHREILGIDLSPEELAALARRYSDLVEDQVVACAWVAGAREFLEAHSGRLPLFVVSGIPEDELGRVVERRGMGRYFTAVRGSPALKDAIIREVLAAHRLAAERTVFVGDAMTDYNAAIATGVPFLGRVAPGRASPFPEGTATIPDLTGLVA